MSQILAFQAFAIVMIMGSSAPAMAQPASGGTRRPEICTQQYAPVCGAKNGVRKTYANACLAAIDAATVTADGACR